VTRPEFAEDPAPIDAACGCYTCRTGFSRGYLRHLFNARELLGYTLASLHNLHFILELMARIREAVRGNYLFALEEEFMSRYRSVSG
jgi:queuine tRNA-ribosyltransferase